MTRTRLERGDQPPPQDEQGVTAPSSDSWWLQFVKDQDMEKIEFSGKLVLLMDILRQCELIGDKVLVFSQSLISLDLIQECLAVENGRNVENKATLKSGVCNKFFKIRLFGHRLKAMLIAISKFSVGRREKRCCWIVDP